MLLKTCCCDLQAIRWITSPLIAEPCLAIVLERPSYHWSAHVATQARQDGMGDRPDFVISTGVALGLSAGLLTAEPAYANVPGDCSEFDGHRVPQC